MLSAKGKNRYLMDFKDMARVLKIDTIADHKNNKGVLEMKRKIVSILLTVCLTFSLTACGGSETAEVPETIEAVPTEEVQSSEEDSLEDLDAIGDVEVDENLFSVQLTIPADYMEGSTQEELDATAKEKGFKSITLHEDGSATYVMTKAQHKEMMDEMSISINDSLSEMIGSEDYPNISEIVANDDFTKFTVTTSSTELSLTESFSVLSFYMYGGMYNIFNGTPVDNVQVDFVNADSGEIISSANSADMEE